MEYEDSVKAANIDRTVRDDGASETRLPRIEHYNEGA
jgi:hypothetical protein